jgi:hypothetical protein
MCLLGYDVCFCRSVVIKVLKDHTAGFLGLEEYDPSQFHFSILDHFLCAAYTTNCLALHNPDGLQVSTPESGTH